MWIQYSTMEWKEVLLIGPLCSTKGTHQKVGAWKKIWGGYFRMSHCFRIKATLANTGPFGQPIEDMY